MDVKPDDILNEIDSADFLSCELDKMTLEDISKDIFEEPDEIAKCNEHRDNENSLFLPDDAKVNKSDSVSFCKDSQKSTSETSLVDKLPNSVQNQEEYLNISERRKDINGNEEPLADENFNNLLLRLNLSDSDNGQEESSESQTEEISKDSGIRERAPISRKRSKNQKQIPYGRKEYDRQQFNPESLRFLCGSNCMQLTDVKEHNHYSIQNNLPPVTEVRKCLVSELYTNDQSCDPITSVSINIESQNKVVIPDCGITDLYYEECGINCVSSPESGYGASITGSPPRAPFFDNVEEQNVLDQLAELDCATDCVSTTCNYLDDEEKILIYLKATENECKAKSVDIVINNENREKELSNIKTSDVSRKCVSVINNVDLSCVSPATSVSVLSDNSQTGETPIACKPVNDKARNIFRAILPDDQVRAMEERIYKNIIEQMRKDLKKKEDVKVIYIEDEIDKTSENRTNLHNAVLNSELEKVFCLVEIHKQYGKPFSDLNLRDKGGKTPLDYALQNDLTLVVEYLKENNCCPSLNI